MLISFHAVTNHPKASWLETITVYFALVSVGQQFGLYQLGGFSGLILVSVVSCWVGWRLAELGWLQDGRTYPCGPLPSFTWQLGKVLGTSGNTPDLLRPRLRTDTKPLPPNSVGQSKFHDPFHSRGLGIDPVSWSEELQRGWHGEGKNHCLLCKQTATPSTLFQYIVDQWK